MLTLKVKVKTFENSKGKSDALNEQFKLVFTNPNLGHFTESEDSKTPNIQDLK